MFEHVRFQAREQQQMAPTITSWISAPGPKVNSTLILEVYTVLVLPIGKNQHVVQYQQYGLI